MQHEHGTADDSSGRSGPTEGDRCGWVISPWFLGACNGVFFGGVFTVFFGAFSGGGEGSTWASAALGGLVAGAMFGALIGPRMARGLRRDREELATLSQDQRRQVTRATWRGSVPSDPVVRATAVRMVAQQRRDVARTRWWTTGVFVAFAALTGSLAVTSSAGWWFAVVFFVAMLVLPWWWSGHLARREVRLASRA